MCTGLRYLLWRIRSLRGSWRSNTLTFLDSSFRIVASLRPSEMIGFTCDFLEGRRAGICLWRIPTCGRDLTSKMLTFLDSSFRIVTRLRPSEMIGFTCDFRAARRGIRLWRIWILRKQGCLRSTRSLSLIQARIVTRLRPSEMIGFTCDFLGGRRRRYFACGESDLVEAGSALQHAHFP